MFHSFFISSVVDDNQVNILKNKPTITVAIVEADSSVCTPPARQFPENYGQSLQAETNADRQCKISTEDDSILPLVGDNISLEKSVEDSEFEPLKSQNENGLINPSNDASASVGRNSVHKEKKISPKNTQSTLGTQNKKEDRHLGVGAKTVTENSMEPYDVFDFIDELENDLCDRVKKRTQTRETNRGNHTENKVSTLQVEKGNNRKAAKRKRGHSRKNSKQKVKFSDYENEKDRVDKTETTANLEPKAEKVSSHLEKKNIEQNLNGNVVNIEDDDSLVFPQRKRKRVQFDKDSNAQVHTDKDKTDSNIKYGNKRNRTKVWTYNEEMLNEMSELVDTESTMTQDEIMILSGDKDGDVKTKTSNQDRDSIMGKGGEDVQFDKTLAQQNSALSKNDAMLPPNEEPSQPKTFSQERSCIMERADKSMNSQNSRSFESDIVPASVSSSDSASKIIDAMEPMKGRLQQKGRLERISVKNVSDIKEQKDQSFGPKKRGRKPKCTTKENEKDRADGTDDIDPKTFNVDVRSVVDDDNSHDEHRKPHTKPKESEKQQSDQYVETLISIGFNVEAVELNGHNETGGSGFVLNGTRSKESIRSTVTDEKDTLTDDINAKPQSHELQQMNRAKNRAGRSRTKRGKIMQNDGSVGDVAPTFQDKALRSSEQARDSITQGKQATPLVMQETEEMVVSENSASSFHPGVDLTDDTTQCTAVDYNEPFVALESISREDKTRVSDAVHVRAKSRTGRSRTKKGRITQNDGSVGDVVPTLQDKTLRSREQGRDSVQQGKQATPLVIQETEEMVVSESTVNDASNFYPGKDLTDDTTQCTAIDNNEPSVVLERIGREDKTQVRNAEHIKTTDMEVIQNNLQSSQEKEIILDEKCSWQSEELFSSQSREKQSVKSSNETFLSQHSKSDNSQTTELRKEEKQISEQSPLEELSNSQKAAKQGLSSSGETVATKQPKQRKSKAERLKRKKKLISEVIVENSTKSKHDDVSESLVEGNCEVHPDNELQENTENSTSLLLGSSKIVKGKETQRTRVPKTVNKDPRRQSAPAYIFASAAIFELNPNMKFGNYSLNLGQLERSSLNMLEPSDNKTDMNSCESICISCKRKIFTKVSEKAFDNIKIASSPPVNLQRKVLCRDSDIAPSRTDTDFKNISIPLNEKEPGEEVIEASSREPNHDDNFDSSNIVEGIKNSLDLHDSNLPLLPENKTAEKDNETNVKNDERFTTRVNQERDTPFDDETNLSLSNRNEDRGTNSHAVMPDNPSLNQNFTQGENDIENGPANVGDVEFYSSDENDDKDAVNDVENPKLPLADYINEHHTDDNVTVSVDRDDDQQLYNDGDKAETFLADDNNMDATVNDPANPEMPLLDDNDFEDMEINGDRESVKGSISVPADQGKASLKERNEPGFGRFASNKTKDKNSSKVTKEKSKSEVIGQKSRNLTDTSTAYSKKYESESLFDSRLTTDESSPRTTEVIPPTPPCSAVKDRGSPDDSIIRKTPSNQQKRKPKNIKKPSGSDSVDLNKPESKAEVTRKRSKNKSHQDVTFGLLCHDNPVKVPNSEQVFDQNDEKPNQRAPQVISDSEDGIQSNEVLFDGESESIISPPKTMEESMKIINDGGISEEEMGPKEQSTSRSADNIEKVPCEVQSGPTKVIKNDRTRSVSSSLPPDQHSPISLPKRPHVNSSPGNHPAQRHLTSTPPRRSRLPNRNYISPHKSQSKSSFLKQVSSWPEYQCKVKTNRLVLGELSPSHSPARTNTRKGTSGLQERMVKEGTLGFHSPNTTDKNLKALGDELYVQHRDVADVDKEDLESRHPRKQVRNDSNMDDENGRKHVKSVLDDENCSLDSEDDGHLNKKSRKKKILIDDDSDSDEEEDEDSILMKPAFPEVKLARVDATPEHSRNQEKKISAPEEEKPDKSLSAFRKGE